MSTKNLYIVETKDVENSSDWYDTYIVLCETDDEEKAIEECNFHKNYSRIRKI